ncbi:MAG TPA: hypothetical protein VJN18_28585 [Polyangiaceae bacterium]|nr:hypothetical protein [Polyangiaceae bacterium]
MKRQFFAATCLISMLGCSGADDDQTGAAKCDPEVGGTICTIAGNGANGYDGDAPIPALEARMSLPQDIVVASDESLYVLDWNNHRIRKLTPEGELLHVAGRGELGGTLDDPANSDFNHPTGMLLSKDEQRLFIAAWHNSKIRSLNLATGDIEDECGDGRRAYFGDDGPAKSATLDLPTSIAFDSEGNLVILDQANQVIRAIRADGIIRRIAGRCVVDQTVACTDADVPTRCPDGSGKFTCGDTKTECAKPCNPRYAAGSDALSLRMAQPFGQSADPGGRMLYDGVGNLYFADTANHLIRRITTDGAVELVAGVEPIDGKPQSGMSEDGTPATETLLNRPTDLALDADDNLYFSDVYNHCIRRIVDGAVETVAGKCGERGFEGDGGPATEAHLKVPYGIEIAGDRLYIADAGNNRIRVVGIK